MPTARDDETDLIVGPAVGTDDYLTEFDLSRVRARDLLGRRPAARSPAC